MTYSPDNQHEVKHKKSRWKLQYGIEEYIVYVLVALGSILLGVIYFCGAFIVTVGKAIMSPLKSVKYFLIALVSIVAIVAGITAWMQYSTVDVGDERISIWIKPDMTFAKATDELSAINIVRYPRIFKMAARLRGLDRKLWIGRYDFSGNVSQNDVLDAFERGLVATFDFTLPEGLRLEEAARIIADAGDFDSLAVLGRLYDSSFAASLTGQENLEGFLFPETYKFPLGTKLNDVIVKLVSDAKNALQYHAEETDDGDRVDELNGLSDFELLTLASIIEAEARDGSERELISSVYHNRLRDGMKLQADPTVRYAIKRFSGRLYYKHLETTNAYNTYEHKGLPPGPINSPGGASIDAAYNPAETEFFYFVADGSGRHIFSRTLEEHNSARAAIKKNHRGG